MAPALSLLRSCIVVTLWALVLVDAAPTYVPSAWLPANINQSIAITQRNATVNTVQYNATINEANGDNTSESGSHHVGVGDGSDDSWPRGNSSSAHSINFKTLDEILALLRDSSSSTASSIDGSSGSSSSHEAHAATSRDQDTASDDEAIKPPKIELPRSDSSAQPCAMPCAATAIAAAFVSLF